MNWYKLAGWAWKLKLSRLARWMYRRYVKSLPPIEWQVAIPQEHVNCRCVLIPAKELRDDSVWQIPCDECLRHFVTTNGDATICKECTDDSK